MNNTCSDISRTTSLNTVWFTVCGFAWGILWFETVIHSNPGWGVLYFGALISLAALGAIVAQIPLYRKSVMLTAVLTTLMLVFYGLDGFSCAVLAGAWGGTCGRELKRFRWQIISGFSVGLVVSGVFQQEALFHTPYFALVPILDMLLHSPEPDKKNWFRLHYLLLFLLLIYPGVRNRGYRSMSFPKPEMAPYFMALGMVDAVEPQLLICQDNATGNFVEQIFKNLPQTSQSTVISPTDKLPDDRKFDLVTVAAGTMLSAAQLNALVNLLTPDGIIAMDARLCPKLPKLHWLAMPGSENCTAMAVAAKNRIIKFSPAQIEKNMLRYADGAFIPGGIEGLLNSYTPAPIAVVRQPVQPLPGQKWWHAIAIAAAMIFVMELIANRHPAFCALLKIFENSFAFIVLAILAGEYLVSVRSNAELVTVSAVLICAWNRPALKNILCRMIFIFGLVSIAVWCLTPASADSAILLLVCCGLSFSIEQRRLKDADNLKENLTMMAAAVVGIIFSRISAIPENETAPWVIPAGAAALLLWNRLH